MEIKGSSIFKGLGILLVASILVLSGYLLAWVQILASVGH